MIYGIGIDLMEVARIRRSIENYGEQFLGRIYTASEREYCERRARTFEHYAARYAAKEAFAKAIGTGISRGFRWRGVEVVRFPGSRPKIILQSPYREIVEAKIGRPFLVHLSLTHTDDIAEASAIIELA